MNSLKDAGLPERMTWIRYEQHPTYGTPFTFPEVLSYVLLGLLFVAILMVGVER